jgi:manganese-dependent inorganic pyrophosphatase
VTPLALARHLSRAAGEVAALQQPCRELAEAVPLLGSGDRISDFEGVLLRSDADDFPVVDGAGLYVGMATRASILDPPRARLYLVDHNELSQAVFGAEEAEIVGVLDHHRLGNPPTAAPIRFVVEPVGSTCTLIAEQCRAGSLAVPPALAGMMLSGILSDTVLFRSPTTTPRDRSAAGWLSRAVDLDVAAFGEELLRMAPGLVARSPTWRQTGRITAWEAGPRASARWRSPALWSCRTGARSCWLPWRRSASRRGWPSWRSW